MLGPKKIFGMKKNVGPEKVWGPKKILGQKKIFGPKNFRLKNILVRKKFGLEKFGSDKF